MDDEGAIASIALLDPTPDLELDPDWPGYMGDAEKFSFTLNVKFDDASETVSLLLLKKDDTYFSPGWLDFYDYEGVASDANTLWSTTFDNLEAGVYFLRITDRSDDNNGFNWATLNNRTDVVWEVDRDDLILANPNPNDNAKKTEFYFVVKGWFGYTIPWDWTGKPAP